MRRYTVRIDDIDHVLDVEDLTSDTFAVHLADGRVVEVALTDEQDLAQATATPEPTAEWGQTRAPAPSLVPPRPNASAGAGDALTAPMPGVILEVKVAVGTRVERGQTLLVLEAMKMQNDLNAQCDGRVTRILVKAGDAVRHGDVLVEFEG